MEIIEFNKQIFISSILVRYHPISCLIHQVVNRRIVTHLRSQASYLQVVAAGFVLLFLQKVQSSLLQFSRLCRKRAVYLSVELFHAFFKGEFCPVPMRIFRGLSWVFPRRLGETSRGGRGQHDRQ